jgi:uncharacterized damage-inducible protein DinB
MRTATAVVVLLAAPLAFAQPKAPDAAAVAANPISSSLKFNYERVKKFILAAADEMPPADYAYKPTPEVRSFGQLIGHIADASYMFCGAAKKEAKPPVKASIEKTMSTKAELKKALGEAFAYCDAVYAASTDATLGTAVELFGNKMPKFQAVDINVAHDNEHYGNIVTYLRLNHLVPPSSQPAPPRP